MLYIQTTPHELLVIGLLMDPVGTALSENQNRSDMQRIDEIYTSAIAHRQKLEKLFSADSVIWETVCNQIGERDISTTLQNPTREMKYLIRIWRGF